jgi:hypothetical protein
MEGFYEPHQGHLFDTGAFRFASEVSAAQYVDDVFEPLVLLSCPIDFRGKHGVFVVKTRMISDKLGVLG